MLIDHKESYLVYSILNKRIYPYFLGVNSLFLKKIVLTLNSLIPKATVAKAKLVSKITELSKYDLIIGSTNGVSLLKKKHILKLKEGVNIIDIGKGLLEKEALKLAIKNYLDNPKLAIKYGRNARKTISEKFTVQIINKKILSIYEEFHYLEK